MSKRRIRFILSLSITIVVIFLLLTGSSVLLISIVNDANVPLGTFITWLGMICLPLSIYWSHKQFSEPNNTFRKALKTVLRILIVLAILWVPICYGLAGNISFTFTEKSTFQGGQSAMKLFWYFTYGIPIAAVLVLFIHFITILFNRND